MNYGLLLGYLALISAQVMIGVNVIIGKYLLDIMPIYIFLGLRFFISAVGLSLAFYAMRSQWFSPYHPTQRIEKYDWMMMVLQGLCGGFGFNFLFLWGLEYTTAVSAGIIGASLPAIIAVSAYFVLKERINLSMGLAIGFAMGGILAIGLNNPEAMSTGEHGSFIGDFLILLAMFPEAWYSIIGKALANRIKPLAAAVISNWVTVILFAPLTIYHGLGYDWSLLTPWVLFLVTLGGIGSLIFFWLWPWGLKYVTATKASLFGGLMPISTVILACIFLGEGFHPMEGIGMILVLVSLWLGSHQGEQFVRKFLRKRRYVGEG